MPFSAENLKPHPSAMRSALMGYLGVTGLLAVMRWPCTRHNAASDNRYVVLILQGLLHLFQRLDLSLNALAHVMVNHRAVQRLA